MEIINHRYKNSIAPQPKTVVKTQRFDKKTNFLEPSLRYTAFSNIQAQGILPRFEISKTQKKPKLGLKNNHYCMPQTHKNRKQASR